MKRIIAILLAVLLVASLVSCAVPKDDFDGEQVGQLVFDRYAAASTPERQISVYESGIKLNDEFELEFESNNDKIKLETEFTMISDIAEEYKSTNGEFTMVSFLAPQIEKTSGVVENGALKRLPSDVLTAIDDANITKYASHTAGISLRFATTAEEIRIVGTANAGWYYTDVTQRRGNYGFEVFVGSGTDRLYQVDVLETLLSPIDKTYSIGTGYKEVLIHLPQGASLTDLKIGFKNAYDGIGLPIERTYDPIVFYGSEITQGVMAAKPSNAYANLTGRLLDANVVNLGFVGGVHGEAEIANYIAGLGDISAFVMEFDNGATLEELESNHYNFYKTVRNAYPDIPIVIMSDPIFSEDQLAESADRVAVIAGTYNRAIEEGDDMVWFLDGGNMFPMTGDTAELYTGDMVTVNDTGMYFMAMALYDIIKSAYTPDNQKLDTTRAPGIDDGFDFVRASNESDVTNAVYTKVSDISSEYTTTSNGVTYVSYSAPQLEVGGINDPADNGGVFYRLDYARAQEFYDTLLSGESYPLLANDSSGGTLRFCTNADEIVLKVTFKQGRWGHNLSKRSSYGVDIYVGSGTDKSYGAAEYQTLTALDGINLEATVTLPEGYKEVMIDFPLYGGIADISIGFTDTSAELAAPASRDLIVHYGPSIAQGASASRPGLDYSNIIARFFNYDNKNLGFSGSARGEQIMAEYIASFSEEMDIFIMDYDHNSATEELRANHYDFYKTVRNADPDVPIIFMSRPIYTVEPLADDNARFEILKATYEQAIAEGDTNVYLIDGREFFPPEYHKLADLGMVDGTHPNDLGMYYTAIAIYEVIAEILAK